MQANLRRIRMESSDHTSACIYPPICTIKLIFDKGAFFILFFLMLTKSHFFFSIACSVAFEDRAFKSVFFILIIDIRKTYSRAQWNLGRKAEKNRSHQARKVSWRGVNVECDSGVDAEFSLAFSWKYLWVWSYLIIPWGHQLVEGSVMCVGKLELNPMN